MNKRIFSEAMLKVKVNDLAESTGEGKLIHFTWSKFRDVVLAFVEYNEACIQDMLDILQKIREEKEPLISERLLGGNEEKEEA